MAENWDDDDGSTVYQTSQAQSPAPSQHQNHDNNQQRGSERGGFRNSKNNNQQRGNFPSNRNSRRGGGGGGGNWNRNQRPDATLLIDGSDVARVIGRGGATVKEIERTCNVRIRIDEEVNCEGQRTVNLTGGDAGRAVEWIERIIEEAQPRRYELPKAQEVEPKPFQFIDWDAVDQGTDDWVQENWGHLPPLEKNFYEESADIQGLSDEQVEEIRKKYNNITVQRNFADDIHGNIPRPVTRFEHCFSNYPEILAEFQKMNYKEPTPIQAQAWPILMSGNDMIGIAQTGTGKTLAFIIPAMIHTEHQKVPRHERKGPTVCILAPTRELAIQIQMEVTKFHFRGMRAVCLYGGASRKEQVQMVEKGVEIVIATPGRLNDLADSGVVDLTSVSYFVLDEADRMLDMGFEPQIQRVLIRIRPDRQTVMTSATWPSGVRRLAKKYMREPLQVVVGTLDLNAVTSVTQHIEFVSESEKFDRIVDFVQNLDPKAKVIIFCGKKLRADDLSSEFSIKGIPCSCIHGQRDQKDREQALADIKSGATSILVATDVASRGIDIEDITHVINYDFPNNIEEYVHRVGRTGRAGRKGTAISYFNRGDSGNAEELIRILQEAGQEVPKKLWQYLVTFDDY